MDKVDFLIQRIILLEQRMTMLEGARGIDRNANLLAMESMSGTIRMIVGQLMPILGERRAKRDAIIEHIMDLVIKQQKYVM